MRRFYLSFLLACSLLVPSLGFHTVLLAGNPPRGNKPIERKSSAARPKSRTSRTPRPRPSVARPRVAEPRSPRGAQIRGTRVSVRSRAPTVNQCYRALRNAGKTRVKTSPRDLRERRQARTSSISRSTGSGGRGNQPRAQRSQSMYQPLLKYHEIPVFSKGTPVTQERTDRVILVYRVHDDALVKPLGRFVTPDRPVGPDGVRKLNLPGCNQATRLTVLEVPKGTEYLSGKTTGDARQMLLTNTTGVKVVSTEAFTGRDRAHTK